MSLPIPSTALLFQLFIKNGSEAIINSEVIDEIIGILLLFFVPATLIFSSVMRSIDYRREEYEGGFVWIIGIILGFAYCYAFVSLIAKFSKSILLLGITSETLGADSLVLGSGLN